jgi:hypothetical protein
MARRRRGNPQSLTSMIDVLFILVFASLAQAAAPDGATDTPEPITPIAPAADAAPSTPGPIPATDAATVAPRDYARAREAGLAVALERLSNQPAVILRVSATGELVAVEAGAGQRLDVGVPLLERVPDRDVALAYLGDRSAELQLCAVAGRYAVIEGRLVVFAPERPVADLPVALVNGLRRDVDRCANAMAVIAEPEPEATDPEVSP